MAHLFVENLTVIDCSLLDAQRGLIGASWIVDIDLVGELDSQSMVFDFGHVKRDIKRLIDEHVDHKLLVPSQYSALEINETINNTRVNSALSFTCENGEKIEHLSPLEAITLIDTKHISQQAVIDYLINIIQPNLPNNVEKLILTLRQEDDYAFYYCYSHGLKKHDGNCQRIAHGHRSRIQIWENGDRSRTWENRWSDLWKDIYIGTQTDIKSETDNRIRFAYDAPQGHFELEMDKHRIYTINADSTVECIAAHIAAELKKKHPDSSIKVKAFEGVGKGAIAEA